MSHLVAEPGEAHAAPSAQLPISLLERAPYVASGHLAWSPHDVLAFTMSSEVLFAAGPSTPRPCARITAADIVASEPGSGTDALGESESAIVATAWCPTIRDDENPVACDMAVATPIVAAIVRVAVTGSAVTVWMQEPAAFRVSRDVPGATLSSKKSKSGSTRKRHLVAFETRITWCGWSPAQRGKPASLLILVAEERASALYVRATPTPPVNTSIGRSDAPASSFSASWRSEDGTHAACAAVARGPDGCGCGPIVVALTNGQLVILDAATCSPLPGGTVRMRGGAIPTAVDAVARPDGGMLIVCAGAFVAFHVDLGRAPSATASGAAGILEVRYAGTVPLTSSRVVQIQIAAGPFPAGYIATGLAAVQAVELPRCLGDGPGCSDQRKQQRGGGSYDASLAASTQTLLRRATSPHSAASVHRFEVSAVLAAAVDRTGRRLTAALAGRSKIMDSGLATLDCSTAALPLTIRVALARLNFEESLAVGRRLTPPGLPPRLLLDVRGASYVSAREVDDALLRDVVAPYAAAKRSAADILATLARGELLPSALPALVDLLRLARADHVAARSAIVWGAARAELVLPRVVRRLLEAANAATSAAQRGGTQAVAGAASGSASASFLGRHVRTFERCRRWLLQYVRSECVNETTRSGAATGSSNAGSASDSDIPIHPLLEDMRVAAFGQALQRLVENQDARVTALVEGGALGPDRRSRVSEADRCGICGHKSVGVSLAMRVSCLSGHMNVLDSDTLAAVRLVALDTASADANESADVDDAAETTVAVVCACCGLAATLLDPQGHCSICGGSVAS